jgi:hypothetical protein
VQKGVQRGQFLDQIRDQKCDQQQLLLLLWLSQR